MQTRSSSRLISNPSCNPTPSTNPNLKARNRRRSKQRIEEFNLEELSPLIVTMADQPTMAQLLQAPIEGYEDAIVVLAITTDNFKLKHVVTKVSTNTSTSGIAPDVVELKDMVKALLFDKKSQSPAPVKAVEESCVTCGGAHSYRSCPATDVNVYRDNIQEFVSQAFAVNYNQGNAGYRPPMMSNLGFPPKHNYPRSDLKAITTRNGVSYDGPHIPPSTSFLPKVVEDEPEATKDTVNSTNNGSTEDVQPQVVQSESSVLTSKPVTSPIFEPVIVPVSAPKPNLKIQFHTI
uniref:Reverse transcriptase domain-containing protein n=1 Tax=Tanacetum cinerariifolium TaxID=118510 RepID=A0A699K135_TANCI|nr:reverse transcriptase domain-containing protein [Tanacetum cinerariifolium]